MTQPVRHNEAEGRFELATDHGLATAAYARDGDTLVFTHTVVPPADEGHGIGSALVAGAMAEVRAAGLKVIPQCPFVAAWFDRHPDQADLLAQ
jgi:predicted GNAT family acetyltransferase